MSPLNRKNAHGNRGMTYIELIVVLSIFAALSSVAIFNYGEFQSKVDVKNLAADVALKIVEAQKSSLSGQLPPFAQQSQITGTWKPSYGIYFNVSNGSVGNNTSFIYFTDIDQSGDYTDTSFCSVPGAGECLDKISITNGSIIESLDAYHNGILTNIDDLTINFTRPNSKAVIKTTPTVSGTISYVQITLVSLRGSPALIKLYPSGRIQIN